MENHHLYPYLNDVFPSLSLDPETYIPYVTGCLDALQDEEELDEIIGLLQASSESHSDDEATWEKLKADILSRHTQHKAECMIEKQKELAMKKEEEARKKQEELAETKLEIERKRLVAEEKARKREEMDPAQRALIEQYAYDQSESYDNNGNLIVEDAAGAESGDGHGGEGQAVSNKAYAEQVNKDKAQQMRATKNGATTKVSERQKTKSAKVDKMKIKEERRKRATKGERRR